MSEKLPYRIALQLVGDDIADLDLDSFPRIPIQGETVFHNEIQYVVDDVYFDLNKSVIGLMTHVFVPLQSDAQPSAETPPAVGI
jgi:hypothetical protein